MHIPLTKPYWGVKEERAVVRAIRSSSGSGDGAFTKEFEADLKKLTGAKHALAVTSCTHGLELAMVALGIGPGDEVILPSFTMTSTANAVIMTGATPVFADIDPVYFNIDPRDIERKITGRTRGIILVHYAGMPAPMDTIMDLAKRHSLFVVEDAAHAIGARYKGKMLGTWGDVGVYSFHGTKNVSCGEGGAVLTGRDDLVAIMDIYRANGTNRKAFLAGIVDRYSWVSKGTSYFLADILAAILVEQIDQITIINKKRQSNASFYTKVLSDISNIVLPVVPKGSEPNWHIYAIRLKNRDARNTFLKEMRAKGIDVSYHYVPLHTSLMGARVHGGAGALPVTDEVFDTLVRLPIYPGLTKKELTYIVATAKKVLKNI